MAMASKSLLACRHQACLDCQDRHCTGDLVYHVRDEKNIRFHVEGIRQRVKQGRGLHNGCRGHHGSFVACRSGCFNACAKSIPTVSHILRTLHATDESLDYDSNWQGALLRPQAVCRFILSHDSPSVSSSPAPAEVETSTGDKFLRCMSLRQTITSSPGSCKNNWIPRLLSSYHTIRRLLPWIHPLLDHLTDTNNVILIRPFAHPPKESQRTRKSSTLKLILLCMRKQTPTLPKPHNSTSTRCPETLQRKSPNGDVRHPNKLYPTVKGLICLRGMIDHRNCSVSFLEDHCWRADRGVKQVKK